MKKLFSIMILLAAVVTASAQTITITGKVSEESAGGAPVPGAAVMVKGASSGTVTDASGNYEC